MIRSYQSETKGDFVSRNLSTWIDSHDVGVAPFRLFGGKMFCVINHVYRRRCVNFCECTRVPLATTSKPLLWADRFSVIMAYHHNTKERVSKTTAKWDSIMSFEASPQRNLSDLNSWFARNTHASSNRTHSEFHWGWTKLDSQKCAFV